MRPIAIAAISTFALLVSVSSAAAGGAHGSTVSASRHADGPRTVLKVENRSTYSDYGSEQWGGYIKRDVSQLGMYRYVDWSG